MNELNPYASFLQQRPQQQPDQQQKQKPQQSGMAGMMGGMMKSDERSKKEIERLTSENAALTKALGESAPKRTSVDGETLRAFTGATTGPDGLTDERRNYYAQKEREAYGTKAPPMSTDLARWASMGAEPQAAPSRASFADSPAANKVAAQNVGMAAAEQQAPQMPLPQPPQSPGFQVNRGMPDMSALDAAYKRIGETQGT